MADPTVEHRVVAWVPRLGLASAPHEFRVQRQWQPLVGVEDALGDDIGPSIVALRSRSVMADDASAARQSDRCGDIDAGNEMSRHVSGGSISAADDRGERPRYRYPTDPSWGAQRQLDLLGARVDGADGALRLTLRMRSVTASWNPAYGFDHVVYTIYISLPDRDDGAAVLPLQNACMPDGLRWQYRLRAGGWAQVLTSAEGADADHEGRPLGSGALVEVDHREGTIQFTLPAAALGRPASLAGAHLLVTTWDYDGGYRGLDAEPGSHRFGGGDGRIDPLVMDDLLIRIPANPEASSAKPQ